MTTPRPRKVGARTELWLPPEAARLWNPKTEGLLETPLDNRGLVDLDALVELGKETVLPDYNWTSPFNDVHHLQWPASRYSPKIDKSGVSHEFREQVQRKAFIPRRFHNWLHLITEPPQMPEREVMLASIAGEKTARALAITAERAVRLTRRRGLSDAELDEKLEKELENYTLYIENAREVPREFQLFELSEVEARDVEGMLAANKRLGKMALHRVPIRDRKILGEAA